MNCELIRIKLLLRVFALTVGRMGPAKKSFSSPCELTYAHPQGSSVPITGSLQTNKGGSMQVLQSCIPKDRKASRVVVILSWLITSTPLSFAWAQMQGAGETAAGCAACGTLGGFMLLIPLGILALNIALLVWVNKDAKARGMDRSEEHTSELQSPYDLVCRLLLEKKKQC